MVNVLMAHSMPFEDIMKLCGMLLMEMKCGLYMRTLQVEKTTTIGWAYMSTKHVHKQSLAVGHQWRVVTTGTGFISVPENLRSVPSILK
jgi:hypothetical protein